MAVKQYVGPGSSITGNFAYGGTTTVLQWVMDDSDLDNFIIDTLGKGATNSGQLNRVLPARHPRYPDLWASRITGIEGLSPVGKTQGVSYWKKYIVTVQYEAPPYLLVAGSEPPPEGGFLIVQGSSACEFIQQNTGQFKYPTNPKLGGKSGKVIPGGGGTAVLLIKTRLKWTWIQVPQTALFGGKQGVGRSLRMKHQEDCLGRVNSDEFAGYEAGTLLLESISPSVMAGPLGKPFYYNVEMNLLHFDPSPRLVNNVHGHNLVPVLTGSNGILWARALVNSTSAKDQSDWWRYQEISYDNLFATND